MWVHMPPSLSSQRGRCNLCFCSIKGGEVHAKTNNDHFAVNLKTALKNEAYFKKCGLGAPGWMGSKGTNFSYRGRPRNVIYGIVIMVNETLMYI